MDSFDDGAGCDGAIEDVGEEDGGDFFDGYGRATGDSSAPPGLASDGGAGRKVMVRSVVGSSSDWECDAGGSSCVKTKEEEAYLEGGPWN